MKTISLHPISKGRRAIVDDADCEFLSRFKWFYNASGGYAYTAVNYHRNASGTWTHDTILMHRMIVGDVPDGKEVDHVNRNGLDNRRVNLRFVTRSENNWNGKIRTDSRTKIRGVSWIDRAKRWRPYIGVCGRRIELGITASLDEAIARRKAAELQYYGHLMA